MNNVPSEILQCLPVRPVVTIAPASFYEAWRSETVQALLQGIIAEQALDRLPILAYALEEAGCHDELLLRHCRECTEHYEFCWVLTEGLPKPLPTPIVSDELPSEPEYRWEYHSELTEEETNHLGRLKQAFYILIGLKVVAVLCGGAFSCQSKPSSVTSAPLRWQTSQSAKQNYPLVKGLFTEQEVDLRDRQATQEMLRKAIQKSEKKP
jgi:hypothetical protein